MSSFGSKIIDVVAALIPYNNNILLCQRSAKSVHAFEWEFPGGKTGKDETSEEALRRELAEELSLEVVACHLIYANNYHYQLEQKIVNLKFYMTRVKKLNFINHIFENVEYVPIGKIHKKNLLAADREFWPYILEAINAGNLLYRFNNGG